VVDNNGLLAGSLPVDFHVATNELALACPPNHVSLAFLSFFRYQPPACLPEWFALHVIQPDTRPLQRCPVDLERVAIHIQEAHELVHLIQDDAREFFPM
jgi:hypothetical protein